MSPDPRSKTAALLGDPAGPTYQAVLAYLHDHGVNVAGQADLQAATGQVLPGASALMSAAKAAAGAAVACVEAGESAQSTGYLAGVADAAWPGHCVTVAAARDAIAATGQLALRLQVISGDPALLAALDEQLRAAGLDVPPGPAPALTLPAPAAPVTGSGPAGRGGGPVAIEVLRVGATYRKASWFFQRDGIELVNETGAELSDVSATLLGADTTGVKLLGSPLATLPPGEPVPLFFEPSVPRKAALRVRVIATTPSGGLAACDLAVPR